MKQLYSYAIFVLIILMVMMQLSVPGPASALQPGESAPEFSLTDLSGKLHGLADYRGKVVIVNFWASWCPECILEMPSLNALYEKNRNNGLVVLGITSDRKKETVLEVLKRTPVTYPILPDTTGGIFIRQYTVIGLPTTYVIDRGGVIAEKIMGRTDFGSASFAGKLRDLFNSGRTK
ncbi:MAG: TlpA family protein disulfide reductase [Nitrospirae bacterium]|nr:TlpA family protein disulfide reductase [Nitrospirota bacterium]